MKKRNMFLITLLSIVLLFGFVAPTTYAQTNNDSSTHNVMLAEGEASYPVNEQGIEQPTSLGVNHAGDDSYPFVYNIIIGAVVLGIILFIFGKRPSTK